jgi:hypothetical protein
VRWVYADDEAHVWVAVDGLQESDFEPSEGPSFVVGASGRCALLDSADAGDDIQGGHLEVSLAPGAYSLQTANLAPNETTRILVHRLRLTAAREAR